MPQWSHRSLPLLPSLQVSRLSPAGTGIYRRRRPEPEAVLGKVVRAVAVIEDDQARALPAEFVQSQLVKRNQRRVFAQRCAERVLEASRELLVVARLHPVEVVEIQQDDLSGVSVKELFDVQHALPNFSAVEAVDEAERVLPAAAAGLVSGHPQVQEPDPCGQLLTDVQLLAAAPLEEEAGEEAAAQPAADGHLGSDVIGLVG